MGPLAGAEIASCTPEVADLSSCSPWGTPPSSKRKRVVPFASNLPNKPPKRSTCVFVLRKGSPGEPVRQRPEPDHTPICEARLATSASRLTTRSQSLSRWTSENWDGRRAPLHPLRTARSGPEAALRIIGRDVSCCASPRCQPLGPIRPGQSAISDFRRCQGQSLVLGPAAFGGSGSPAHRR